MADVFNFTSLASTVGVWITQFGLNVLAAIVIILIGLWLARTVRRFFKRLMIRQNIDPTLTSFLSTLLYYSILTFVIIAALNRLGVQTASVIAVLGAAGLAVGLALQGSLENFAAGVLMLIFRPFRVGDYIEGGGMEGTVESISLFTTHLVTLDNRVIVVPNGKLNSDNIVNHFTKGKRRVDIVVGVSYSDNLDQARRVILDELAKDSRILADPAPKVVVLELGDSSVNLGVRPWVNPVDYWDVYFDAYEYVKKRLDAEGITIPFPQRDVHLFQEN